MQRLAGLADRHDITRVVAVVGAAHVPGIRDKFADYTLMQSINWDGHQRFSSAIRAGEHAKQEKVRK